MYILRIMTRRRNGVSLTVIFILSCPFSSAHYWYPTNIKYNIYTQLVQVVYMYNYSLFVLKHKALNLLVL